MRDTRSEAAFEISLDENSPELLTRKMFLTSYLTKICSDQSKMAFWEYLDQVGWVFIPVTPSCKLYGHVY